MSTILIILVLILLLGWGATVANSQYGGAGLGGILGLVLFRSLVWVVRSEGTVPK